jgi:hypothetical protein
MATDAVPFGLLRSSLDDFKLKFQAVDDPGSPSKAWLVHVHDRGDEKPAIYARADGFDSPSVESSPSTRTLHRVAAIVRRVPPFKRVVQLAGYQRLDWICEGAAELLDALPAAVQHRIWRGLPDGTQLMGDGLSRWMLAVFEIGNANVAGSSLRCNRRYPITGDQAKAIFAPASGLPVDADWYATLPDFAAASVQAIAILQSWLDEESKREDEAVGQGGKSKGGASSTRAATADVKPLRASDTKPSKLCELDEYVLLALGELKAFDKDTRRTAEQVATHLDPKNDRYYVKKPLAKLKQLKLADSHQGANGGSWLTAKGRRRFNTLNAKR